MFGSKKQVDVLVVGAGPVGLFAALQLAVRGVNVQVVDKEWRTGAHSYALALHPSTLELLDALGLADSLLEKTRRVDKLLIYDSKEKKSELRLADLGGKYPFVSVLRQDHFEGLLESALLKHGVKVLWNHKVSRLIPGGDGVVATVDRMDKQSVGYSVAYTDWVIEKTDEVPVSFVIGADGHNSTVRRTLKLEFPEVGPAEHFAVFEFGTSANLGNDMRVVFEDKTTNVLWPMPGGRCRWSFQLAGVQAPESSRRKNRLMVQFGAAGFAALTEEDLHRFLRERAPWFEGTMGDVNWRMVVRFERRLVSSYGKDRMWLAGDAAHLTGPVGVQSMNAGLTEATELADILADTLMSGSKTAIPAVRLADYERRATAQWRRLLGLDKPPKPGAEADPFVANLSSRLLPCLPATANHLDALLAQVGLRG